MLGLGTNWMGVANNNYIMVESLPICPTNHDFTRYIYHSKAKECVELVYSLGMHVVKFPYHYT